VFGWERGGTTKAVRGGGRVNGLGRIEGSVRARLAALIGGTLGTLLEKPQQSTREH